MSMNFKVLVCLALVLGGGLLVLANTAQSNPAVDQPQSNQSLHPFGFDSIHMIDRETGWAQNARAVLATNHWIFNDKAVWRTTNGGETWICLPRVARASRPWAGGRNPFGIDQTIRAELFLADGQHRDGTGEF